MTNDWDLVLATPDPERSVAHEIAMVVEKFTQSTEDWTASTAAHKVVDWLVRNDPDLLNEFLAMHAVPLIRDIINREASRVRSQNRHHARRSVFARAATYFESTGDPSLLHTEFLNEEYAVDGNRRLKLADMRASDLLFVVKRYESQAAEIVMRSHFLRALADRCGDRPVREVFTEQQLATMWNSLVS